MKLPRLALCALALGLSGCPKAGVQATNPMFEAPKSISWTENVSFEGFPPAQVQVEQRWTPLKPQNGQRSWELVELQTDAKGSHERTKTRVYLDATGYGYLSATTKSGEWAMYMPPEQLLPATPTIGATWKASHNRAGQSIERACELAASSFCPGGVVTVCDTATGPTRRIFRDHFCPGVGWSGFEAMQAGPQGKVRIWSTDVRIDGKPAPAATP